MEIKNFMLFLFIFAICCMFCLHSIEGEWLTIPKKVTQIELFLLINVIASFFITLFLVAIKFLEAINRTPIIADFINWTVVERKIMMERYELFIAREIKGTHIDHWLTYKNGITELEAWILIHNNIIVEDEFPEYKRCKEVVMDKMHYECSKKELAITGYCGFTLNPALYRHLDKKEYGGFWIPKRPLCLEHFLMSATIFLIGSGAVKFLEWVIGHFL